MQEAPIKKNARKLEYDCSKEIFPNCESTSGHVARINNGTLNTVKTAKNFPRTI